MPLSREALTDLAHDHCAADLLTDDACARMIGWTLEEASAFFESGGDSVPDRAKPMPIPPPIKRHHDRMLLCLHSSAGSGEIMRSQMASLTGVIESFDLAFLEGMLEMDPAVQPEARMLRQFFPGAPNRSYLQLVEVDEASGEERPVLLATNALAAGGGNALSTGGAMERTGVHKEYRGLEAALQQLAACIASASARGERYDGVLAFSQGGNLLTIMLGLLEAAEAAASAEESHASALAAGPEKAAAKAAARAAAEVAARRSRLLRPPFCALFCAIEFGYVTQLRSSQALAARCLSALDAGIAQACHPDWNIGAASQDVRALSASLFAAPLSKVKAIAVVGVADPAVEACRQLATEVFAAGTCTLLEHQQGHKMPSAQEKSVCVRISNFCRVGLADEIIAGCSAFYRHRRLGWLAVKVTKVDYQGVADGGATYCVTAPELDGEVETVRERLALAKPEADGE